MSNIDRAFEDDISGTYILPGLKEYRQKYNKGSLVFDIRFMFSITKELKLNAIVNNLFNAEYVSRPADIQAPRNFILQLQFAY